MAIHTVSLFPDLAEVSPGQAAFISDRELILDIETIIGYGEQPVGDFILKVKIRSFYLHVLPASASVVNGTRYQLTLQKFDGDEKLPMTQSSLKDLDTETQASTEGTSWVPTFRGTLRASAPGWTQDEETLDVERISRLEIPLIAPLPNNVWKVGNEAGDIRKPGGFLYGSYFQEARREGLNDLSYLSMVRLKNKDQNFEFSFGLVVKKSDFHFELYDAWGREVGVVGKVVKDDFAQRMKSKLMGISIQKELRKAATRFKNMLQSNEILICIGRTDQDDVLPSFISPR